ncbi:restriction endonuclease subunit S [Psychrobacter sp. NPDC078631]|uniref:restriction endonuclease subunit S n=1 Tax=Psychrobacter sp. NPDC078631 TaxID=3390666 RepID=UPI003D03AF74
MVPKGWEVKTLEQAKITVTDGDRGKEYPKSSEFFDSGYCLFLSAKNVTKNGFSFLDTQFISREKHTKLRKGVVKRGDIVLTTRGSVGQFAYYDHTVNFENIRINSGMVTLGCSNSELESDFFYALSKSSLISRQIDSAAFGSAQPQLTVKIIKSLKLPVPPLREQQKIAKILSTWDKAISTTERLIDNSTQQKKALMQQLLTGKKRLLDESGERFEGEWEEVLLGSCADLTAGGTPSTKKPEYWGGEIPWMNSGEVNLKQVFSVEGRITQAGLDNSSTKIIPTNSILIALAGQGKTRGTIAINRIRLCTNQSIAAIMPHQDILDHDFLYFNLDGRYEELRAMSTGAGGRGGLNLSILKSITLNMPTFKEQQKIATVLTNADKEIELLEQQLADFQQEKKALMQVLLTGKKRVVVDGEVA